MEKRLQQPKKNLNTTNIAKEMKKTLKLEVETIQIMEIKTKSGFILDGRAIFKAIMRLLR